MSMLGSMSMPGTFRRTKTALVGPKKMPNDPLEGCKCDIDAYDTLLSLLGSISRQLQSNVVALGMAAVPIVEPLDKFYSTANDVNALHNVTQFCDQVNSFKMRIKDGDAHIESMLTILKETQQQIVAVREAFTARDLAYQTRCHYIDKVDSLRTQLGKAGTSPKLSEKLSEKLGRNEEKRIESESAFQKSMEAAQTASHGVLEKRFTRTNELLSKLCKYYGVTFESASILVREFNDLHVKFRVQTTAEQFAARGQELVSQTRDKISNVASGWRDKLGGLGSPSRSAGGRNTMQEEEDDTISPDNFRGAGGSVGSTAPEPSSGVSAVASTAYGGATAAGSAMAASASAMAARLPWRQGSAETLPVQQSPQLNFRQDNFRSDVDMDDGSRRSPSWNPELAASAAPTRQRGSSVDAPASRRRGALEAPPQEATQRSRKKDGGANSAHSQRPSRKSGASPTMNHRDAFGGGAYGSGGFAPFSGGGTPGGGYSTSMGSSSFSDWPSAGGGSPQGASWDSPAGSSPGAQHSPSFGQFLPGNFGSPSGSTQGPPRWGAQPPQQPKADGRWGSEVSPPAHKQPGQPQPQPFGGYASRSPQSATQDSWLRTFGGSPSSGGSGWPSSPSQAPTDPWRSANGPSPQATQLTPWGRA